MSIDIADIASLSFQNQASLTTSVDPVSLIETGASLEAALSLANSHNGDLVDVLASAWPGQSDGFGDLGGLPADASAAGWEIIDDSGGGYIDVYAEPVYAPEGFCAEDLYEIEFLLDTSSGELTILLHFSQDPLDYNAAGLSSFDLLDSVSLVPGSRDGDDFGSLCRRACAPKMYANNN
ncbi:MAG: hypothetical protein QOG72_186 [Sphingomonadales bacterium]|jgi:hypothetical protein|nr:hypothetical protein [Sphingomonadales bacterium]